MTGEARAKRVAMWLDRWTWGWRVQPLACIILGHVWIPAASWYVAAKGMRCAYCLRDQRERCVCCGTTDNLMWRRGDHELAVVTVCRPCKFGACEECR